MSLANNESTESGHAIGDEVVRHAEKSQFEHIIARSLPFLSRPTDNDWPRNAFDQMPLNLKQVRMLITGHKYGGSIQAPNIGKDLNLKN